MVDRYRRHDSDDNSLEEGEARITDHRSKGKIDRDTDSGRNRRRDDSDSSESDKEDRYSSRRRRDRDLPKSPKYDEEDLTKKDRGLSRREDKMRENRDSEEESMKRNKGDNQHGDGRNRDSSRRRRDRDFPKSPKSDEEDLSKKDKGLSGRGGKRRENRDSSDSEEESKKKKKGDNQNGDGRNRDSSRRRRDRDFPESPKSDEEELSKRDRGLSRRGDKRGESKDSSDSEEELKKKKKEGNQNGDSRNWDSSRRDNGDGRRRRDDVDDKRRRDDRVRREDRDKNSREDKEDEKKLERRRDDKYDNDRHRKRRHGDERVEDDRQLRRERDGYERRDGKDREEKEKGEDVKKLGELDNSANLRNNGLKTETANMGRSGGVYIPPFKLAQMMKNVEDKSSVEYQRLTWDALRKSINGLVNKVNAANIKNLVTELFSENLIRGRGLFCRSCMKSQMASPGFTDVFAALVAVVNTKFPEVGELLLKRIVLQLKRAYKRNDKHQLLAAVKFVAHLVNQQVAHEIIALELLTILLENPSDDSVEVAVGFVTECGSLLQDLSPQGLHGIFERFRGILHEGEIDKRVQYMIEGLFAIRKAKFQGHPAVRPELDLVDQEDQLTHEVSLDDEIDPETTLDIFKSDPQFVENEKRYEVLMKNILGDESTKDEVSSDEESDDEEEQDSEEEEEEQMKIKDETETNLVNLRRTIYLTIMSSVDFEEAGHKLLKIKLESGQEMELCIMLLECCSQERTYLRYYGLLGQRFCMINKIHQENFEKCFVQQYSMIHRLETNKLRNVAKFFAHLLGTDALPWHVLSYIRLTEEDTTSSSRIFIKILFQELSEHLGIRLLNEKLTDPTMQDSFESIFPKDNPKNTRFSINFFTSIGLGGITENLREYLKNMPRLIMQQQVPVADSDSDSGSDASPSSSSSESESEKEASRKKRRR